MAGRLQFCAERCRQHCGGPAAQLCCQPGSGPGRFLARAASCGAPCHAIFSRCPPDVCCLAPARRPVPPVLWADMPHTVPSSGPMATVACCWLAAPTGMAHGPASGVSRSAQPGPSPSPAVQAIKQIGQQFQGGQDTGFARSGLLRRLGDGDWKVVDACLGCPALAACPAPAVLQGLKALAARCRPSDSGPTVLPSKTPGPKPALQQKVWQPGSAHVCWPLSSVLQTSHPSTKACSCFCARADASGRLASWSLIHCARALYGDGRVGTPAQILDAVAQLGAEEEAVQHQAACVLLGEALCPTAPASWHSSALTATGHQRHPLFKGASGPPSPSSMVGRLASPP